MLFVYWFLWPLRLVWLLVCCLHKEVYLQIFKCVSFWFHGCCGEWEGGPVNQVNRTSWVAVVTPTDRPKSVRNCSLIELFVALFVLSLCPFDISVSVVAFVIGLGQIFSFLSRKQRPIEHKYLLHGHTLEAVQSGKYIGAALHNNLNWTEHICNIRAKSSKTTMRDLRTA